MHSRMDKLAAVGQAFQAVGTLTLAWQGAMAHNAEVSRPGALTYMSAASEAAIQGRAAAAEARMFEHLQAAERHLEDCQAMLRGDERVNWRDFQ